VTVMSSSGDERRPGTWPYQSSGFKSFSKESVYSKPMIFVRRIPWRS
jgi:hypothetical protein